MGSPGVSNIISGYSGAIRPFCSGFDLEGDLSLGIIPSVGAVSQQRIDFAIEHVVEIRGLEHGHAGIVLLSKGHSVVAV
ncbi:hypothetical protein SDC9_103625 [bioreactor metagenome]|uniref:Uncharacterized protein n=1 Tax=bioreactor metagenome TaxID=1076179 RepID=A0A645AUK6_9ZZZZ